MRVFVTGASGFVGSAIVKELVRAGHEVLGLARSNEAAQRLLDEGAVVHRGDLDDHESLKQGAASSDAVIHTAFNHDFSRFKTSCEEDRQVILALGEALQGTRRPLVITSGIGVLRADHLLTEEDTPSANATNPRVASEEAAKAVLEKGGNVYVVRLPPTTHGEGDHGFVPMLMDTAKQKGTSAYIDEGTNRWPAVHRYDAALMYRLIIEQQPSLRVFHAVAEEGIPFRSIAQAIGDGLQLPVTAKSGALAEEHFSWFLHFASMSCAASSQLSRQAIGWEPTQVPLLDDMKAVYFR